MYIEDFEKAQGHWILARMGKKVLRPGGKELTCKLVDLLNIGEKDDVVEFAPGLCFTANMALKNKPHSYIGIDADKDAIANLRVKFNQKICNFMLANAAETQLPENSKDKVWGEAMLTMHADHRKSEIIKEAHRILKKGGLYAIHELGLTPNNIEEETKAKIQKELALSIKVNARPLTQTEWVTLLENQGFKVVKVELNGMCLLETARVIDDEGLIGALKIGWNIIRNPKAKKRVLEMRNVFKKYKNHMNAIVIVAQKI